MSPMLFETGNHSTLLPITWQGKGTPELESLQSVFRKIAFAHRVTPGLLFDRYFRGAVKRGGVEGQNNRLTLSKLGRSIAGDSILLRCVAEQIEKLTGELDAVDASLVHLTSLLSPHGLAHRVGRFCPYCFLAGCDAMYGRALWDFAAVTACPIHGVHLVEPCCGAPEGERIRGPWSIQLTGVCARCGSKRMRCQRGTPMMASGIDVWAAKNVGKVIAYASVDCGLDAATIRQGIKQCVALTGRWGVKQRDEVGLTYEHVHDWTIGNSKPSLQGLLSLAAKCRVQLLDIFRATVPARPEGRATAYWYPGINGRDRDKKSFPRDRKAVQDELRKLIADEGIASVTGQRLAERLNVAPTVISTRFPKEWAECQRIREDNVRVRAALRDTYLETRVDQAIESAQRQGYSPTVFRVTQLLGPMPSRYGGWEITKCIRKRLREGGL